MLSPSLKTISEVSIAASSFPPMMTMLLSWLTLKTLDPCLFSVRVRRQRVTQPPCWTLHCMQLLCVDEAYPPHTMFPACTWLALTSGSGGSSHVEFCHGRNNSADCSAPSPPVIRMASELDLEVVVDGRGVVLIVVSRVHSSSSVATKHIRKTKQKAVFIF